MGKNKQVYASLSSAEECFDFIEFFLLNFIYQPLHMLYSLINYFDKGVYID